MGLGAEWETDSTASLGSYTFTHSPVDLQVPEAQAGRSLTKKGEIKTAGGISLLGACPIEANMVQGEVLPH